MGIVTPRTRITRLCGEGFAQHFYVCGHRTAILRPDSDVSTELRVNGPGSHYGAVTTGGDDYYVWSNYADDKTDKYGLSNTNARFSTSEAVRVYLRARSSGLASTTGKIVLHIDGSDYSEDYVVTANTFTDHLISSATWDALAKDKTAWDAAQLSLTLDGHALSYGWVSNLEVHVNFL